MGSSGRDPTQETCNGCIEVASWQGWFWNAILALLLPHRVDGDRLFDEIRVLLGAHSSLSIPVSVRSSKANTMGDANTMSCTSLDHVAYSGARATPDWTAQLDRETPQQARSAGSSLGALSEAQGPFREAILNLRRALHLLGDAQGQGVLRERERTGSVCNVKTDKEKKGCKLR